MSVYSIPDVGTDVSFAVKFVGDMKTAKIMKVVARIIWNQWLDDKVTAKFILIQPDEEQYIRKSIFKN